MDKQILRHKRTTGKGPVLDRWVTGAVTEVLTLEYKEWTVSQVEGSGLGWVREEIWVPGNWTSAYGHTEERGWLEGVITMKIKLSRQIQNLDFMGGLSQPCWYVTNWE